MREFVKVFLLGTLLSASVAAQAQSSVLVARADTTDNSGLVAELSASFDTVDDFGLNSGAPTLQQLLAYDVVVAYTNYVPSDPSGTGDVLADYVDQGGCLVIATYSFSAQWAITGRIQTAGYSPLTDEGIIGDVSGDLNVLEPGDPIFSGVDLGTLTYFHNSNFAHSGLDAGATLLADDGRGINMIARNASGNVVGLNLFPPNQSGNNEGVFQLFGNAAANCAGNIRPSVPMVPVPVNNSYALLLLILGVAGLGMAVIRKYD